MKKLTRKTCFSVPLIFVSALIYNVSFCQTWDQGGNSTITSEILGTGTGTGANLRITTNGNERIRVEAGGDVGIGMTNPAFRVDVSGGDINVNTSTNGYRIDGEYVLWHNDNISNIYVGVGAGAVDNGSSNTFMVNTSMCSNITSKQKLRCSYKSSYQTQPLN